MKYLPLIWSGIWRKRGRTILIMLQIAVAFALFGVLQGMKTGVDQAIANTRADVLYVGPSVFGAAPLPRAYLERLRAMPGVKATTFADGLLGTYQKPSQVVYVLGLVPDNIWLTLAPEILKVSPKDLQALRRVRTGKNIDQAGYSQAIRLARRRPDSFDVSDLAEQWFRRMDLRHRGHIYRS